MTLLEASQRAKDAGAKLAAWDDKHYPKHANPTAAEVKRWLEGRYPLEIASRAATRALVKARQDNGVFEPLDA